MGSPPRTTRHSLERWPSPTRVPPTFLRRTPEQLYIGEHVISVRLTDAANP